MPESVKLEDFKTEYPEFKDVGDSILQGKLDQAERETPPGVWGNWTHKGIMLRAAHALSTGPSGSTGRVKDAEKTTYSVELKRFIAIVAIGGGRVI